MLFCTKALTHIGETTQCCITLCAKPKMLNQYLEFLSNNNDPRDVCRTRVLGLGTAHDSQL